jgi:hypothetical protein
VRRLHSSTYAQYVHRIASHTKSTYRGFDPSGTGGGGAPELTGVARISCLLGGGGGGAFLRPGASGSPWDIVRLGCCGGGGPWSAGDFWSSMKLLIRREIPYFSLIPLTFCFPAST